MKHKILFRVDGNSEMGLGHLFRSLALVDMLKKEFACIFATKNKLSSIHQLIESKSAQLIEIPEQLTEKEEFQFIQQEILKGISIVVLDGYHFDTLYQRKVKSLGVRLVCIDDIFAYHFVADVIINHAGGLRRYHYSINEDSHCFFGPSFALLQQAFLNNCRNRITKPSTNNDVFICFGGADPKNDTLNVLKKCSMIKEIKKCHVVIGAAYRYQEELDQFIKDSRLEIKLYAQLKAIEMVGLMQQCRIAICPPSTIAYEYMCSGGILYLYQTASNQEAIKQYCLNKGLAFRFENFPINNKELEQAALQKQIEIFDGKSEDRIVKLFKYQAKCYQFVS